MCRARLRNFAPPPLFMLQITRTQSNNKDFKQLVTLLDAELRRRDGDEDHVFFSQFNKIDALGEVVVAYQDGEPAGCGAIKPFDAESAEVKRMFVQPPFRGKGIAPAVLAELETWATELGFKSCVLETGQKMPEAIGLYQKSGYRRIANYGQYAGVEQSVCMKKVL
jgi:putative acetyltransferase